jgi:hypothetical protein
MTPRHQDDDESGALAPSSRGAWKLALLVGAVLSAAATVVVADHALAVSAARDVVLPVSQRLDEHLIEMRGKRELMELYVREEQKRSEVLTRKLDALCRASARPQVCLGEP